MTTPPSIYYSYTEVCSGLSEAHSREKVPLKEPIQSADSYYRLNKPLT